MSNVRVAPSLLAADLLNLADEVRALEANGADALHIDVMDGHFVPNITFGPAWVEQLKALTILPLDVHLMVNPVEVWIEKYAKAGAASLTIHLEGQTHLDRCLRLVKSLGCKAGVALNPGTAVEMLQPVVHLLDKVLIMTVNPGFAGQKFIPTPLEKIGWLKKHADKVEISVDGGVSIESVQQIQGADYLVIGSALFKQGSQNYQSYIQQLKQIQKD